MPSGPRLEQLLEPLLQAPERAAVLLDIDGVLAPIVRHADDAHVPEPTRKPLIAIAKRYGLVACVSGRRAAVGRRIVSLGSITYIGNHGTEVLRGGATTPDIAPEAAEHRDHVQRFARSTLRDEALPAARLRGEDKDAIYAFHWRGAPDEAAAEKLAHSIAERAEDEGLGTHWGRKVLEIRPPIQLDKGTGVRGLLHEHNSIKVALYAGDDRTDLDAWRALREAREEGVIETAVCVGVRSDETPQEVLDGADVLIDGPAGVRAMLEKLAGAAGR